MRRLLLICLVPLVTALSLLVIAAATRLLNNIDSILLTFFAFMLAGVLLLAYRALEKL